MHNLTMDDLRSGTWIVHTSKHLNLVNSDAAELDYFEASYQAGKAGNLLARMAADDTEVIPHDRVAAYARSAHVRSTEIDRCLHLLKRQGKVDYSQLPDGSFGDVEVYSFSNTDALRTTARIFDELGPSPQEHGSIQSLERTFYLPQTHEEMLQVLGEAGLEDRDAVLALSLQDALGLIKTSTDEQTKIYYNEYAFKQEPTKALKAVRNMDESTSRNIHDIQELLTGNPGYPMASLEKKFPSKVIEMMEGVGLLDAMPVRSPNGQAIYVTIPQLRGVAIDEPIVSADAFHKAKTLLNCLRYGQHHSHRGRGRIVSDQMLIAIVRKLVRGEALKPSTAAGEDYRILERDGVIETQPAYGSMFTMKLRQKEIGQLVLQMLLHSSALPEMDIELMTELGAIPVDRDIPEARRTSLLARRAREVETAQTNLLQVVRTGARTR